jgi:membrane-associated phospholipid phosphatase
MRKSATRHPPRMMRAHPGDGMLVCAVRTAGLLEEVGTLDRAIYAAVAESHTPRLDRAMARLSVAANYSRLSLASAALLGLTRGETGRKAAGYGLASLAATATVVNVAIKPLGRRERPDRGRVPRIRQVRMPRSRSLPSGHTAAAFAFATGVGAVLPWEGAALHILATAVGYSRVHTGVHYPGDVIAGGLTGTVISYLVVERLERSGRTRSAPAPPEPPTHSPEASPTASTLGG